MSHRVVVSDSSVLIDLERGSLFAAAFALRLKFCVPDLLYRLELQPHGGARLLSMVSKCSTSSYCQIWCTEGWSCGGPAVLYDLDAVRELDPLDHFAELPEAA